MNKNKLTVYIVGGVMLLFLLFFGVGGCTCYNGMVKSEEKVNETWANVQASYQRRFDLIPNIVSTVKGYAAHESNTLEKVTNARAGLIQAGDSLLAVRNNINAFSPDGTGPSAQNLEDLARGMQIYVNAVREAYPDLKASVNFMNLQQELESTENRINQERNYYNEAVREYNVTIRKFPNNIFAGMFGFSAKNLFSASNEAQSAPVVSFD